MRFKELGELPVNVRIDDLDEGSGIEATLLTRRAKWHKTCRDNFNDTKLKRLEKRKSVEPSTSHDFISDPDDNINVSPAETPTQRLARSIKLADSKNKCCFCCDKSEQSVKLVKVRKLHEAETKRVDARVRY